MLLGFSFVLVLLTHRVYAKTDCAARLAACNDRSVSSGRAVCGTDNQTYSSRCHLLSANCREDGQILVTVKHKGHCKEQQPCWADLGLSEEQKNSREPRQSGNKESSVFVPTCLEDGRYAPIQCHNSTGYCWCVTPSGKPIPNTSVRHSHPTCNRRGKTRRGSSSRGHKQKKDCGRIDRSTFVTNLVKIFRSEYNRLPAAQTNFSGDGAQIDRRVLEWKFSSLDHDGNDWLTRDEYRDLRRLVKKVVKPRRCARTFAKNCDLDKDLKISRQEWTTCLGMDFNPDSEHDETDATSETDFAVLQESVATLTGHLPYGEDVHDRRDEPEAANDCLSDRQAVMDETRTSNAVMYIPECTPDGRYQKIQCYKSTGYCWCVHEDTGKPIPGTSVKDLHPKCDSVQAPARPMKGCPEHKKQAFLKDLMDFLMQTMASQKASNSSNKDDVSGEEQIASWNFSALDTNKNKMLERNEWKRFRTMISSHRKLRRCGKKLPRYCDVNHDRKISMTEWLNCLNAQRASSDFGSSPTANPRRRGPNPLESYLKGDD